jgi:hypothetical protein
MYLDLAYAHSKLLFSVVKHLNLSHIKPGPKGARR